MKRRIGFYYFSMACGGEQLRIENVFSRVKDLVRITLRRDKTSVSYLGFLHLACAILNIRRDNFLARKG